MNRTAWGSVFVISFIAVAFGLWWPRDDAPLVQCVFLRATGWPCPFCGMTRAFLAMGQGAWGEAFRQSPVGALLFPIACALTLSSGWRAMRMRVGASDALPHIRRWMWISLALALAVNWLYRLGAGLK
ncbi:MAG: DUF2752 domain-containing protein [Kiritimatiellae bacterium]|nr:DUF2752 domain-containing protein [Kiritimatiellia bacterium]